MAEPKNPREGERGTALLTVLLLVAVMSVVAASGLERLTLATRTVGNADQIDQVRAYQLTAEATAAARIGDLVRADPKRTTLAAGWNGVPRALALPAGTGAVTVTDGGNCFNLNSLVSGKDGATQASLSGIQQFRALAEAIGIDPRAAGVIANAAADWIDTDSTPQPTGAEDETYARAPIPYRTANRFMADPSELRAVQGVTPALYTALKPWLCALPTDDASAINVNTLMPDQAPLLMMLAPGQLSFSRAQAAIAARPPGGFAKPEDMWNGSDVHPGGGTVKTRWFAVQTDITLGNSVSREISLFDAERAPVRLVRRQWGDGA